MNDRKSWTDWLLLGNPPEKGLCVDFQNDSKDSNSVFDVTFNNAQSLGLSSIFPIDAER